MRLRVGFASYHPASTLSKQGHEPPFPSLSRCMGKQQQPPQPVVAGVLTSLCFSHLLWEWEEEVRRCGDEFMLQDPNSAPLIQTVTSELSAVEPPEVEKRHHYRPVREFCSPCSSSASHLHPASLWGAGSLPCRANSLRPSTSGSTLKPISEPHLPQFREPRHPATAPQLWVNRKVGEGSKSVGKVPARCLCGEGVAPPLVPAEV